MKIAILGAGNVGGNLGRVWAARGHDIIFGVRDPQKQRVCDLVAAIGAQAAAASMPEAARQARVVVLAIPWAAVETLLADLGPLLDGKIVIDATNRLTDAPLNTQSSAGHDIARMIPQAQVVKAYNTIGAEQLLNPVFDGQAATMFICGDDRQAKAVVTELTEDIGFEVVDCGDITNARMLEELTRFWIYLAYNGPNGRDIAFKLLSR
jgi:8-hydroxy-5-deazaflavin:NADPH oxidoreductase